jgi:hypothetical protein
MTSAILRLPREAFEAFIMNFDLVTLLKLGATCKRLYEHLGLNMYWQKRAQRDIFEYMDIDPEDMPRLKLILQIEAEEHQKRNKGSLPSCFWRKWYMDRYSWEINILYPLYTTIKKNDNDIKITIPRVGTLFRRARVTDNTVSVAIDVRIAQKGKHKGMVTSVVIADAKETLQECRSRRGCTYTLENKKTIKLNEWGGYTGGYNIVE